MESKTIVKAIKKADFSHLIPANEVLAKHIGIRIAEHHGNMDAFRKANTNQVTESEASDALMRLESVLNEIEAERNKANTGLEKYSNMNTLLNTAKRVLQQDREESVPFGPKVHALIFTISKLVMRQLGDMCRRDGERFFQYATGIDTDFWFTTGTQALCTNLNRNEMEWELVVGTTLEKRNSKKFQAKAASFRGKNGFYSALESCGFVQEKVVDGTKVRLKIDLKWLFGFDLNVFDTLENPTFSDLTRGNSSHLSQSESYSEETNNNQSGEAPSSLQEINPTIVGEKIEKREEKKADSDLNTKKKEENISPGPADFSDADLGFDTAVACANAAKKLLFNKKMLDSGRIKYNSVSTVTEITEQDWRDMPHWMFENLKSIKKEGDTWSDVGTLVIEAITMTKKYMDEHPTRWVYHPKFYLNPKFNAGTLKSFIENCLRRPERSEKQGFQAPSEQSEHTPQLIWLFEQGGDRHTVMHYVRKFGENVVSDAIAFAGVKLKSGFKPQKGAVSYIFGILKNLDPRLIGLQLEKEKIKLDQTQKGKWTAAMVVAEAQKAFKKPAQLALLTIDIIQKIADYANSKNANVAQVNVWISAVCEGRKNMFTSQINQNFN